MEHVSLATWSHVACRPHVEHVSRPTRSSEVGHVEHVSRATRALVRAEGRAPGVH